MLLTMSGCIPFPFNRVTNPKDGHPTVYGAQHLSTTENVTPLDLPTLIAPEQPGVDTSTWNDSVEFSKKFAETLGFSHTPEPDKIYEQRLARAYKYFDTLEAQTKQSLRTQIQEALIGKSHTLCTIYKKQTMQTATIQNLVFGDATTLLSALAAIFTQASVVRPLAGAAAIASGFRSEFNADVFANLNLQVITAGIEKRRSEYYAAILKARQCTIQEYPLQEAIKDAFYFHASCSLYAGLEEANLSIKQAQSPGLDSLIESFQKLSVVVNAAKALSGNAASNTPTISPSTVISSPTTATYSTTATTQHVSPTCELPVPGSPKASVPPRVGLSVVTADGQTVPLPFTSEEDPVAALAAAQTHREDTIATLQQQFMSVPSDPKDTKDYLGELKKASESTRQELDSLRDTAVQHMTAYKMARIQIESDTSDTDKMANDMANLLKARANNAKLTQQINSIRRSFDSAPAVQALVNTINNRKGKK
jgi:hypothetical protein